MRSNVLRSKLARSFRRLGWPVRYLLLLAGGLAIATLAAAQPAGSGAAPGGDDDLAAKATDPTAALMSFQVSDWYTASFHGIDDSANQVVFRAAIPFSWGSTQHIFRITQPFATDTPGGATGIADTTIFDLMVFNQPWGRWGVGIAGTLPTGRDGLTTDKWTAGPAIGFVNASTPSYNWGLFLQSFFSYAGRSGASPVGIVNLQPIFSLPLGQGRSVSLGNSAFVYDTRVSRWASLQLGLNYGAVLSFAGQKWRPNIEADYDFRNTPGNAKWVIRAGVSLLVPAL